VQLDFARLVLTGLAEDALAAPLDSWYTVVMLGLLLVLPWQVTCRDPDFWKTDD
jgi:hypothetical protein